MACLKQESDTNSEIVLTLPKPTIRLADALNVGCAINVRSNKGYEAHQNRINCKPKGRIQFCGGIVL